MPPRLARSRLLYDKGRERYDERKRRFSELMSAQRARDIQDERKAALSSAFSLLGGSLLGPIGIFAGDVAGRVAGDLGTIGGKQAEEYKLTTDTGKFDRSEEFDLQSINEQLEMQDKMDIWRDVVGAGTSAALAFKAGGGDVTNLGDFSFTKFGGKAAGENVGTGLFKNLEGEWSLGEGTAWNKYTSDIFGEKAGDIAEDVVTTSQSDDIQFYPDFNLIESNKEMNKMMTDAFGEDESTGFLNMIWDKVKSSYFTDKGDLKRMWRELHGVDKWRDDRERYRKGIDKSLRDFGENIGIEPANPYSEGT
jgi:hypothetical protein